MPTPRLQPVSLLAPAAAGFSRKFAFA